MTLWLRLAYPLQCGVEATELSTNKKHALSGVYKVGFHMYKAGFSFYKRTDRPRLFAVGPVHPAEGKTLERREGRSGKEGKKGAQVAPCAGNKVRERQRGKKSERDRETVVLYRVLGAHTSSGSPAAMSGMGDTAADDLHGHSAPMTLGLW